MSRSMISSDEFTIKFMEATGLTEEDFYSSIHDGIE